MIYGGNTARRSTFSSLGKNLKNSAMVFGAIDGVDTVAELSKIAIIGKMTAPAISGRTRVMVGVLVGYLNPKSHFNISEAYIKVDLRLDF